MYNVFMNTCLHTRMCVCVCVCVCVHGVRDVCDWVGDGEMDKNLQVHDDAVSQGLVEQAWRGGLGKGDEGKLRQTEGYSDKQGETVTSLDRRPFSYRKQRGWAVAVSSLFSSCCSYSLFPVAISCFCSSVFGSCTKSCSCTLSLRGGDLIERYEDEFDVK